MTRRSTSHPGRSGRSAERASSHSSRGLGEVLLLLPLLSARGEALQQEAGVPSRHAGAWCCLTMRTSRLNLWALKFEFEPVAHRGIDRNHQKDYQIMNLVVVFD